MKIRRIFSAPSFSSIRCGCRGSVQKTLGSKESWCSIALGEVIALLDKPKKNYMFARQIVKKSGSLEGLRMASDKQNLQDVFLNAVRKSKGNVTIFLVNGVKLSGVVTWFDNYCVLLRKDSVSQLIYKHAISTILPSQPVTLFTENQDDG